MRARSFSSLSLSLRNSVVPDVISEVEEAL